MLHMDIRLENMVLHITSGLKQQWQFSPWIMSHRFQLPLHWYACVRLIRYTFMSSATKHLASQRDAHLLLRTIRPLAAWRNVSWASSLRPLLSTSCSVVDVDCQCTHRGSYGNGGGRVIFMPSWQLLRTHRCSKPRWLWFFPLRAEVRRRGRGEEAIIQERGSNLVMSCGDKWRISHLNHNLHCLPCSRRQFPICPVVYIRWHLQISGAAIV